MPTLSLIADTHRLHRQLTLPECDVLIHCGDFCNFQEEEIATLQDADAWFAEAPAKHVVCTGGNHDSSLQHREFAFRQAEFLADRLVEVAGLAIYGSPWCPDLTGFAYFADTEQLADRWRRIPSGIDVLVTHTPPLGILDLPRTGMVHLGCPMLRQELKRIRPRLHVFGHVHASRGHMEEEGICFVNASVVGSPEPGMLFEPAVVEVR